MRTKLLTGAAALALTALAMPQAANAAAYVYSALDVTAFSLQTSTTSNATLQNGGAAFGGFDTFQFISRPTTTVFNGNSVTMNQNDSGVLTSSGFAFSQPLNCQGACAQFTNDVYFPTPTPLAGSSFAVADSNMNNTGILGSGATAGAGHFGTQSGVQITDGPTGANSRSASTGTKNSMNWNFSVTAAELLAANGGLAGGTIHLHMTWNEKSNFFVDTTTAGDSAQGTSSFTISLKDAARNTLGAGTFFANDELISSGQSPSTAGSSATADGPFSLDIDISAVGSYSLTFLFDTSADAELVIVPEPTTLALLGAGLLGLGIARRRRRA